MADTKTSALTALTAPAAADAFPIYDSSAAELKKILHSNLCISGTFTPVLEGATVAGVQTYSIQTGNYSRIGNIIIFDITLVLSAKDGATTGILNVTGLPAVTKGHTAIRVARTIGWNITAGYQLKGYIVDGQSYITLTETDGSVDTSLTDSDFGGTETIMIAGSYIEA